MSEKNNEKYYEPLAASFNNIENAMTLKRFASVEAVLYLLMTFSSKPDPEKAYLLFTGYHLINMSQSDRQDYILQCARLTLGYYRSKKFWQDDYKEYKKERYNGLRAFDYETLEGGKTILRKAPYGYPFKFDDRLKEWERFWQSNLFENKNYPKAEDGKFTYYYDTTGDRENSKKMQVEFSRKYNYPVNEDPKDGRNGQPEPITVTIEELLDCAKEMTLINKGDHCYNVLKSNVLKSVNNHGKVSVATELTIKEVVNIVGMVGSGKSTLIKVLAFWASKNGKKMVIVLDTVVDVFNMYNYFENLKIDSCPLVGRKERLKYINQIARDDQTCLPGEVSKYLTNACIIDGMNESEEDCIVYGKEPCYSLYKSNRAYICPHFDVCNGTRMLRECYTKSVVLTTVAGFAMTRVGKNREAFFNCALDSFDIVIFDESDKVQKTLDRLFMPDTSFNTYINECANDCGYYMQLSNVERNKDRARLHYDELQRKSVSVLNCLISALKQELGSWNKLEFGDWFSAMALLDDMQQDNLYKLPTELYNRIYSLMDYDEERSLDGDLQNIMKVSCDSTDFDVFDSLYSQWVNNNKDIFERKGQDKRTTEIRDNRIKLILCLIYFDRFVRKASDAYCASHETSYGQNELFEFLQSRFKEQQWVLPSSLCGNLFGMKKSDEDDIVLFRQFAFGRSLMKDLPYLRLNEEGKPVGPHVIMLSGSSWAEGSYEYHVNRSVNYIIEADAEKRNFLAGTKFFESGFIERVSGAPKDKKAEMLKIVTRKSSDSIINEYYRRQGKILLIVNSYEQARIAQEALQFELSKKSCGAKVYRMVSDSYSKKPDENVIRRGEISKFAFMDADILIAPAISIERGYNIVDESGHSALGSVFFLVRPMSVPDDIQDKGSKLNGYMEAHMERREGESLWIYNMRVRQEAMIFWSKLTGNKAHGLNELDEEEQRDIVSTLFVLILQIFGRLARITDTNKDAPRVYFMDGAFRKPQTANGESSGFDCLDSLGKYLDSLFETESSAEIAKTLYEPFYKAFKGGINYGG